MSKTTAHLAHADETLAPAVDQAVTQIRAAVAHVPGLVHLSDHERSRVQRVHTGAERYIAQMAALIAERPALAPKGVDAKSLTAQLDRAQSLAPLRAALAAALAQVDDTILAASGAAYHDALDVYAIASSVARRDHDLHAAIAAFEAFLSTGPRHAPEPAKPTGG